MAKDAIQCDELYCSLSHDDDKHISELMRYCNKHVIRFFYVPRVLKNMQLSLKPQIVGGNVLYTNFYVVYCFKINIFSFHNIVS